MSAMTWLLPEPLPNLHTRYQVRKRIRIRYYNISLFLTFNRRGEEGKMINYHASLSSHTSSEPCSSSTTSKKTEEEGEAWSHFFFFGLTKTFEEGANKRERERGHYYVHQTMHNLFSILDWEEGKFLPPPSLQIVFFFPSFLLPGVESEKERERE